MFVFWEILNADRRPVPHVYHNLEIFLEGARHVIHKMVRSWGGVVRACSFAIFGRETKNPVKFFLGYFFFTGRGLRISNNE